MRNIKFRAWNKKRKRMYEVLHLHLETSVNNGPWASVKGHDIIEGKDIVIQVQPNNIELMQYTGLKDNNGVEIYEGDLFYHPHGKHGGIYNVYFENGNFEPFNNRSHGIKPNAIEIIGNIHENKNLLEDENIDK